MEVNTGWIPIPLSSDEHKHYGQVLSRLKRMKDRWRPAKETASLSSMSDRIRAQLASERAGTMRSHMHWFGVQMRDKSEQEITLQLGKNDNTWRHHEERRAIARLEFRHKSNVPHEFDKYDRPALEEWMKSFDPMGSMGEPADLPSIEGKSTAEIRRIADFKSYKSTYMAPAAVPDAQADAEIKAQLKLVDTGSQPKPPICMPPAAKDSREPKPSKQSKESNDATEESGDVTVQTVAGSEAKYVLMAPDDSVAEEAAAIANNIGQVVHQ